MERNMIHNNEENSLQKMMPLDHLTVRERITRLVDYVEVLEKELFDKSKIKSELLDVKLMKYDKAKKALNDDMNFLFKMYSHKSAVNPELANFFSIIGSLDVDKIRLLTVVTKALIQRHIYPEDIVELIEKKDKKIEDYLL